jgi:hypothetical protein
MQQAEELPNRVPCIAHIPLSTFIEAGMNPASPLGRVVAGVVANMEDTEGNYAAFGNTP